MPGMHFAGGQRYFDFRGWRRLPLLAQVHIHNVGHGEKHAPLQFRGLILAGNMRQIAARGMARRALSITVEELFTFFGIAGQEALDLIAEPVGDGLSAGI